jgi:excisionase family DNA binding protein
MLTPAEIAKQYRVSPSLVYEWCRIGGLKHYRFGRPGKRGKVLVEEADLQAFLAERRVEGRRDDPPPASLKHIRIK